MTNGVGHLLYRVPMNLLSDSDRFNGNDIVASNSGGTEVDIMITVF